MAESLQEKVLKAHFKMKENAVKGNKRGRTGVRSGTARGHCCCGQVPSSIGRSKQYYTSDDMMDLGKSRDWKTQLHTRLQMSWAK